MFARSVALCICLLAPSAVLAQGTLELVPRPSTNCFNPCGVYGFGENVTIDVMLSQTSGSVHHLRMIQLDFSASDAALVIPNTISWTSSTNHFDHKDGSRLSNTFHGDLVTPDLGLNTTDQFTLPADGSAVKVGEFTIGLPISSGVFTLDALNVSDTSADGGAQVRFGYSLTGTDLITVWRNSNGMLNGGSVTFQTVNQTLAAADPVDSSSVTAAKSNLIIFNFSQSVGTDGPIDLAGKIEIRELTADCGLGAVDLAATPGNFAFEITNGGMTLRIAETAAVGVLSHQTWYAATNTGNWTGRPPFKMDFVHMIGDVDGSLFTAFTDIPPILEVINTTVTDATRRADIDGSGFIAFTDIPLILVEGVINTAAPAKPSGHGCGQ